MTEKKKPPDWERIEIDYRTGTRSTRELGAEHGVSHTAINKRAKAEGWVKDLHAKVKAKADSLVSREEVSKRVSTETKITETLTVEVEAEVQARVRLAHRADIARFRKLCLSLLEELEAETADIDLYRELGDLLRIEDKNGQDRRNDLYAKIISSAGRVDSLKKLSETLKHLVGLEREAYGIAADAGDKPPGADDVPAMLAKLIEKLPG